MFREMRRKAQEVSAEECRSVLAEAKRGVLTVHGEDGYPYGIPVNFYFDESDGRIYIHCAKEGHKIDAVKKNEKVCFTTWNKGFQKDGDWAWNVTSVVAFGRVSLIDDVELTESKTRALGIKYYPTAGEVEEEIRSAIARVQLLAIDIDHMTGKLVNEK